jgi:lamin tail-like protein
MRLAPAVTCFALALTLHLPGATSACADAPLRLNEIMAGPARDWDGSGLFSSRDDEWVEVVNTGIAPLDLSPFLLTDADSIPRYAFSGMLGAGARLVVYGKTSWDWERATGHPAFGLSLSNSGDSVLLWQIAGAETVLVDQYAFRSHEAAADRAIGRSPDAIGGWVLFDGLNPYTGATPPHGNACNPSPGAANICGDTPTRHGTWGSVKSLYR